MLGYPSLYDALYLPLAVLYVLMRGIAMPVLYVPLTYYTFTTGTRTPVQPEWAMATATILIGLGVCM